MEGQLRAVALFISNRALFISNRALCISNRALCISLGHSTQLLPHICLSKVLKCISKGMILLTFENIQVVVHRAYIGIYTYVVICHRTVVIRCHVLCMYDNMCMYDDICCRTYDNINRYINICCHMSSHMAKV